MFRFRCYTQKAWIISRLVILQLDHMTLVQSFYIEVLHLQYAAT